ncbi:hypothetical protein Tco_0536915 [Tanacetum coccineum]
MFVAMSFDNLKFCDSNDSTFIVDITSRFPVSSKSIELVTEGLETVVGVGTGVCCICVMRGVGDGGRVVADTRGGSAIVVTRTSTSEVALVLRVNIKSIPVSVLGLSMLEMKPDDTEELCC